MAVLSVLRGVFSPRSFSRLKCTKNTYDATLRKFSAGQSLQMAGGGHNTLPITPSRFQHKKFLDMFHLYLALGIIPLGTLVFFVNIYIGPAQLAEIPEGYEPKQWEYYQHPISRFFVRYMLPTKQELYEKNMHYLAEEHELAKWRKLEKKIKKLMRERGDYKSWYYIPYDANYERAWAHEHDEINSISPGIAEDAFK